MYRLEIIQKLSPPGFFTILRPTQILSAKLESKKKETYEYRADFLPYLKFKKTFKQIP